MKIRFTGEFFLALIAVALIIFGALTTPGFLTVFNLSQLAAGVSEKALIVLPMVLLIIAREIDLSVASILALASVVFGVLLTAGYPLWMSVAATVILGGLLGAFNGLFIVSLGLPSLVVTLGTMALFRGAAYVILGSGSINIFPDSFLAFGVDNIGETAIPQTFLPFLLLAPLFALVLQFTPLGRRIYALGASPEAALYSGISVNRIRLWLFVATGAACAIAGIVYTARLANARANNAVGMELDVITIALLGGVSVFGGKGKLTAVLWALVLIATVRNLLGLNQIGGDAQGTVIGLLLVGSLLINNLTGSFAGFIQRTFGPGKAGVGTTPFTSRYFRRRKL
ncbi:ABC transporter permease [Rhizobium rhizogenes]|uniref:Autoinducer 2 import system permease protein LsrD n=1 Tax=Rhizobium rhizogenes TaxID=359 RepID=A0AA92C068_RHIRH|nr:ABC transporter permease [Rhizobium rhizogenes]PVE50615.1 ABC transporter permease [Rhizobium rhizogenes]PVE62384.1 ABC transporter permease [Agrobacterium tumefaciens]PVE70567.1 ABC transporter permease [Sphingomonas sp. TPD3009]